MDVGAKMESAAQSIGIGIFLATLVLGVVMPWIYIVVAPLFLVAIVPIALSLWAARRLREREQVSGLRTVVSHLVSYPSVVVYFPNRDLDKAEEIPEEDQYRKSS